MKALLFSPAAEGDLDDIWDYSAVHWGPGQADRYTDEIHDACYGLATGRRIGMPVEVRPGTLKLNTGLHSIYFRDEGDRIIIIRILHGRQDRLRHL